MVTDATSTPPVEVNANRTADEISPAAFQLAAASLFFVWLFGCINNLLVIVAIISDQCLRTPMNAVLLNLSLNDVGISMLGTPLAFVAAIYHGWPFGEFLCQAYGFFMTLTGMTAIGTVTAIAIDRYVIISTPHQTNGLTVYKAIICITFVWIYSFSLSVPPLFGWNHYILESPGIACSIDWETTSFVNSSYIIYIFIVGYVFPIFIMAFCYGRVIQIVRNSPKMTRKNSRIKAEQKVTMMAAAMLICTLAAWTPYALVSLLVTLGYAHLVDPVTAMIPSIFAKSSVIYNPIVYFFLNTQIRNSILKKLHCKVEVEKREDTLSKTTKYYTMEGSVKPVVIATTSTSVEPKFEVGSSGPVDL